MLIYLCSSSHGFGHAARDAAVLQELRRLRPEWTLVLSSGLPPVVLSLLLGDASIQQRPCQWDVGMVQADALGVDQAATLGALDQLAQRLPALIEAEAQWLTSQGQPVLILGDIPPAAAALAQRTQSPLVWMSNFGWDDIYAPLGPAFQRWADEAVEAYRCGDLLLRCPFDLPMNWGLPERRLGLVCGRPRVIPADLEACLDAQDAPLVLVGFGGLGLSLSPHRFNSGQTTISCFRLQQMLRKRQRSESSPISRFCRKGCGLSMCSVAVTVLWASRVSAASAKRWPKGLGCTWWSAVDSLKRQR